MLIHLKTTLFRFDLLLVVVYFFRPESEKKEELGGFSLNGNVTLKGGAPYNRRKKNRSRSDCQISTKLSPRDCF